MRIELEKILGLSCHGIIIREQSAFPEYMAFANQVKSSLTEQRRVVILYGCETTFMFRLMVLKNIHCKSTNIDILWVLISMPLPAHMGRQTTLAAMTRSRKTLI